MPDLDLAYMTATDLRQSYLAKELSPVEVIENTLDRIEEANEKLNCFCFIYPEEALKKAQAVEQAIMAGDDPGPLAGVPLAIKDLTPTKGQRTRRFPSIWGSCGPSRSRAARGAVVEEVSLDWSAELDRVWYQMWGVFMAAYFGQHLSEWCDRMDPDVVKLIEAGQAMSAVDYKRIEFLRSEQWRELARVLSRFDALLAPTMAQPAAPVEDKGRERPEINADGKFTGRYMTEPFNLVGQCPVLSVPTGFTSQGLPTALSICGRRYDDLSVLKIAAALEQVRPWRDKRPPI